MRNSVLYLSFILLLALSCKDDRPLHPSGNGGHGTATATETVPSGITYQLNVYSFADSDGDGWGDFRGITQHLDYLEALGVSALWLSPVQKSMSYHGYDVIDYSELHPKLGTETDFKNLIDKARAKGIDIYMDYVLNHSGSANPWFVSAKASKDNPYRSYYVFSNSPGADIAAGLVDNYGGGTEAGMGTWHTLSSYGPGYSGRLHFILDWDAKTLTVSTTTFTSPAPDPNASIWLYYGTEKMSGFHETSPGLYEQVLDFDSSWGFLIRTSTTSWASGTKYGGNGADLVLGKAYPINNTTAGDITFGDGSGFYFASFNDSMPDLNYGPYTSASSSETFKALAATADKWINMGVNGLRLDAVQWIYQNQPTANVAFLKQWYDHCNATYKARGGSGDIYMVGECLSDVGTVTPYFAGLPSMFDFSYWWTLKDRIDKGKGDDFASTIVSFRNGFKAKRSGFIDAIKLSNHDETRAAEVLGKSLEKEKLAAAVLLTSPGKPFIYQGEELGYWGNQSGGDEYVRSPIKWTRSGSVPTQALNGKVDAGMLSASISVEAQEADDASLLNLYRAFAAVRNAHPALLEGEMTPVSSGKTAIAAWRMTKGSETLLVLHNFSGSGVEAGNYATVEKIISNGTVTTEGKTIILGPYASVIYKI